MDGMVNVRPKRFSHDVLPTEPQCQEQGDGVLQAAQREPKSAIYN